MNRIRKIVLSGLLIALGIMLPFLTGQIPQIGSMLLPMHIPVLLCGFFCGWKYGLAVGFVTPLLRSMMFGMPPILTALAMAFELATYGVVTGIMNKMLAGKKLRVYISLVVAMITGRIVWGLVKMVLLGVGGKVFPFQAFLAGGFLDAFPGIVLQFVLIPMIMSVIERVKRKW